LERTTDGDTAQGLHPFGHIGFFEVHVLVKLVHLLGNEVERYALRANVVVLLAHLGLVQVGPDGVGYIGREFGQSLLESLALAESVEEGGSTGLDECTAGVGEGVLGEQQGEADRPATQRIVGLLQTSP